MRSVQVQFTIDDLIHGEAIASELLEEHLVACAQAVGPVTSRYWWNGSIQQTDEWLFLCKTTPGRVDEVIAHIRRRHPYDVPEIISIDIGAAYEPYVDWIVAETHPPRAARS